MSCDSSSTRTVRPFIVDWEPLAGRLIERIHREALGGVPDAESAPLLSELLAYPGVPRGWRTPDLEAQTVPFLTMEFRKDEFSLRFFSTLTTLGAPQDITLQELRIESFFPADQVTEDALHRLAGA